jgi:hypothetical protein
LIDGDHDGTAGGDAVAVLGRGGAVSRARTGQPNLVGPAPGPWLVDVILEQGDLIGRRGRG